MRLDMDLGLAAPEKPLPMKRTADAPVRLARPAPPVEADAEPKPKLWPSGRIDGMFNLTPRPVQWFIDERMPAGRGLVLSGVGGSSKTTLLYALAIGAVLGRLPWDWRVSATGSAALFLTEDTADDVHRAMHAAGASLTEEERQLLVQRLRVFPLAGYGARLLQLNGNALVETDVFDWVMEKLEALSPTPVFVGIDPALGVTEGDEMSPAHQRRLGELVDRIGIETGACTVLATHSAKGINQAEELGSHSSRGSGAITDAVRGEYVLRNMTADEARRFGVEDRAERQRYVQLATTKGNRLPPEAFTPVWLKRGVSGMLSGVTLEQIERSTVGTREMQALELLKATAPQGDTTLKFWREQCIAAGVISKGLAPAAAEKAIRRICDALIDAGHVQKASRGLYRPTEET